MVLYQGRNLLEPEGAGLSWASKKLGPPVKCGCLLLLLGVNVRNKSLAQYYHNTSKVSLIIIDTINIAIKFQKLLYN